MNTKLKHYSPLTRSSQYRTGLNWVLRTFLFLVLCWYVLNINIDDIKYEEEDILKDSVYPYPTFIDKDTAISLTDWQRVGSTKDKVFSIYSAYVFFPRKQEVSPSTETVEVIATYKRFGKADFKCQFHYSDVSTTASTPGVIEEIKGWRYLRKYNITGHTIKCKLPRDRERYPDYVSVLVGNQTNSPARVQIQYSRLSGPIRQENGDIITSDEQYQFNFSVCVKPVYNMKNDVLHLIEWFEFYKLMGVQQFTFYNLSMGQELSCILNHIQALSKVVRNAPTINVLPWNNYPLVKEVARFKNFDGKGKSEVFQECLYRHRGGRSKYLINVDLDEFIMPHDDKIKNYEQLMVKLEETYNKNGSLLIGDYIFRNGFYLRSRNKTANLPDYCKSISPIDNQFANKICQNLWMIAYEVRDDPYQPFGVRTKNILKPDGITNLINHYAIGFEPGYTPLKVAPEIAFSRHYRSSYFRRSKKPTIDPVPTDFAGKLVEGVSETAKALLEIECGIKESDLFGKVKK